MKAISESTWSELPFADYRPRFFVELFRELLSMETPHFYQARLMNVISSAQELIESIDLYHEDPKYLSILQNSVEEFQSSITFDPIAESFYKREIEIMKLIFIEFGKDNVKKNFSDKAVACLKSIMRNRENYYIQIVNNLRDCVVGSVDLSKTDRNLSAIYSTLSVYVSSLLSRGYSPTYLFNRMEYFTRINNYGTKNFQQQFNSVIGKLDGKERQFTIYFKLQTNKKETLLKNEHFYDVQFMESIPDNLDMFSTTIFRGDYNLYVVSEVRSLDYIGASWKAKELMDQALDFIRAKEINLNISQSKNSLAVFKVAGHTYKQSTNIDLLVRFLSHDRNVSFDMPEMGKKLNKVLSRESLDHLGRSLRYLNIGRDSVSIEQKLLNTWISLETLFIGLSGTNIIGKIVDFVPQAYAYSTLLKRAGYILKLLTAYKVSIPEDFKSTFSNESGVFDKSIQPSDFHNSLLDEKLAIKLFDLLNGKEHLKFRLKIVFEEISSREKIKERLKKTDSDVIRQLRRLYLYRNKIAHLGHISGVKPQIVNHLVDYLMVCYKAVFTSAACGEENSLMTVADAIICYHLGIEEKNKYLTNKDVDIKYSSLCIRPVN